MNDVQVLSVLDSQLFVSIIDRWAKFFNHDAINLVADYIYDIIYNGDSSHTLEWKFEQAIIQSLILEANLDITLVPPEFPSN